MPVRVVLAEGTRKIEPISLPAVVRNIHNGTILYVTRYSDTSYVYVNLTDGTARVLAEYPPTTENYDLQFGAVMLTNV